MLTSAEVSIRPKVVMLDARMGPPELVLRQITTAFVLEDCRISGELCTKLCRHERSAFCTHTWSIVTSVLVDCQCHFQPVP